MFLFLMIKILNLVFAMHSYRTHSGSQVQFYRKFSAPSQYHLSIAQLSCCTMYHTTQEFTRILLIRIVSISATVMLITLFICSLPRSDHWGHHQYSDTATGLTPSVGRRGDTHMPPGHWINGLRLFSTLSSLVLPTSWGTDLNKDISTKNKYTAYLLSLVA